MNNKKNKTNSNRSLTVADGLRSLCSPWDFSWQLALNKYGSIIYDYGVKVVKIELNRTITKWFCLASADCLDNIQTTSNTSNAKDHWREKHGINSTRSAALKASKAQSAAMIRKKRSMLMNTNSSVKLQHKINVSDLVIIRFLPFSIVK